LQALTMSTKTLRSGSDKVGGGFSREARPSTATTVSAAADLRGILPA
jgi:hypothetical protein